MAEQKGLWLRILLVLWILVVFLAYYWVHKPLEPSLYPELASGWESLLRAPFSWTPLADSALNLLIAGWMVLIGIGLGHSFLGWLENPEERLFFAAALGLGLLSMVTFALGLVGLLYRWLFYLIFALASLLLLPRLRTCLREARLSWARPKGWLERLLAFYCVAVLLLALLEALAPPTGWDALTYHLAAPKTFMAQQRISPGIDIPHFYFPALVEMLFMAAMILKGDVAAQLLHFTFALLSLWALYAFAKDRFGSRVAWLSCAILLSAESLLDLAGMAYVDLGLLFFLFLAFWAAVSWLESRDVRWLVLSGALIGLAMDTKYTGLGYALALGGLLLIDLLLQRALRGSWRQLGLWALVVGLVASPWYLKNLLFTGNPVYPFLFPGWNWDAWRADWYTQPGTGLLREPWRLLIAPWEATVLGIEGKEGYQATIGPLFLALLPLLFLGGWGVLVRRMLLFALLGYGFWLLGVAYSQPLQQTRLLLPLFSIVSLLSAWAMQGVARWARPGFSLERFSLVAVGIALLLQLFSQAALFASRQPLLPLLGKESRDDYLIRRLGPYYAAMTYINQNLEPGSRVYFLWEPRGYYSQQEAIPDVLLDRWSRPLFQSGSLEGILAEWRGRGISHVLLYRGGLDYLLRRGKVRLEEVEALKEMERRYLDLLYGERLELDQSGDPSRLLMRGEESMYALYRVRYPGP